MTRLRTDNRNCDLIPGKTSTPVLGPTEPSLLAVGGAIWMQSYTERANSYTYCERSCIGSTRPWREQTWCVSTQSVKQIESRNYTGVILIIGGFQLRNWGIREPSILAYSFYVSCLFLVCLDRVYPKCLDKLQEWVPHAKQEKKFRYMFANSFRGIAGKCAFGSKRAVYATRGSGTY
jgi:hypothetical protein